MVPRRQSAKGHQSAAAGRPVRRALPLQEQQAAARVARRRDRVREAAADRRRPAGAADLRRDHDAVGFHRQLPILVRYKGMKLCARCGDPLLLF